MLITEYFCSSSFILLKVDGVSRRVSRCSILSNLIYLHPTLT
jgi:hypothetical protein